MATNMCLRSTNRWAFMLAALLSMSILAGCSGTSTFREVARAGDTVALAAGWKHKFSRDNITVTITPPVGGAIVYGPNDARVRLVVNLYPDPVSSILVSRQTGQDLTDGAQTYAQTTSTWTGGDTDWWQTTVFIDLPTTIPTGRSTITISNPQGETVSSTVNIVDGTGSSSPFSTNPGGPLNIYELASLERVKHNTVNFTGSTIPFAIELNLTHDPDVDHGGAGRAGVINPRGEIKSVQWQDTGTNLHVILLPSSTQLLSNMVDFKFYVAGNITNLSLVNVKAYDVNGNPVAGVAASVD